MPLPIQSIGSGFSFPEIVRPGAAKPDQGFQSVFEDAVQRVDSFHKDAAQSVEKLLSGESEEVHQTVLATQKAELSMELFLQMKNKAVQAYQEVMRMQL